MHTCRCIEPLYLYHETVFLVTARAAWISLLIDSTQLEHPQFKSCTGRKFFATEQRFDFFLVRTASKWSFSTSAVSSEVDMHETGYDWALCFPESLVVSSPCASSLRIVICGWSRLLNYISNTCFSSIEDCYFSNFFLRSTLSLASSFLCSSMSSSFLAILIWSSPILTSQLSSH